LLSAEDDVADTVRPRLDVMGADVDRVVALQAVRSGGRERSLNLADDLEAVEQALQQVRDCKLLVVDPISAYCGRVDSHRDADLRGTVLAPLAAIAERHDVAVLLIGHLNKSGHGPAIYRGMGSLAFAAASRCVWTVAKDKDDPQRRLVLPVKMNIAGDQGGLAYRLDGGSVDRQPIVLWEDGAVDISADDALRPDDREDGDDEASAWLKDVLDGGPIRASEVLKAGKQNGFSEKQTRKAFKRIGGQHHREGFGPGSTVYWTIDVDTTGIPDDFQEVA